MSLPFQVTANGVELVIPAGKSAILTGAFSFDASSSKPATHPLNFSSMTLPDSCNVIRGASVNPTRASGWTSFSGTVTTTPAQVYTDYRELHSAGVAEVLGFGHFSFMDAAASCKSLFGFQSTAEVDAGATILSAAAAPAVGVFAGWFKTLLNGPITFTSGAVAACAFMSFQANVTDVSGGDTSILNMEVASGGIGAIFRIRMTAAKISRALFWFDAATVAPIIQTPTLFTDPNAATCEKGLHVRIGTVSYMIPLYIADSGALVADW